MAGYPAILKTGYWISGRISGGCRIPDIRPDILPDTGYFNACSLFDRVTQIIETSQIFNQEQKCIINIRFAGYPAGYSETGYLVFNIRYPAGYWISGKPDIKKTFLLLFEDLRCFNYLSNFVEQRTGIEISGIRFSEWPDIPKTAIRSISKK